MSNSEKNFFTGEKLYQLYNVDSRVRELREKVDQLLQTWEREVKKNMIQVDQEKWERLEREKTTKENITSILSLCAIGLIHCVDQMINKGNTFMPIPIDISILWYLIEYTNQFIDELNDERALLLNKNSEINKKLISEFRKALGKKNKLSEQY